MDFKLEFIGLFLHVIASQCSHWRGNPPDERCNETMRLGQVFPRYRGIPTPSCGMVRDDTVYFVTALTAR